MGSLCLARRFALVLIPCLAWATPLSSTTLLRKGLDRLAVESETIVQARVLDIHSYWNPSHDFILTDVRARPTRSLKGESPGELTFTLMGGSVDDVTILVVGGADLSPGSDYVLFLSRADLPGAVHRLTIPDHAQGAFLIERDRVRSQALDVPLIPDATGSDEPIGGRDGLALEEFVREIRSYIHD